MKVTIIPSDEFSRQFKRLAKISNVSDSYIKQLIRNL